MEFRGKFAQGTMIIMEMFRHKLCTRTSQSVGTLLITTIQRHGKSKVKKRFARPRRDNGGTRGRGAVKVEEFI